MGVESGGLSVSVVIGTQAMLEEVSISIDLLRSHSNVEGRLLQPFSSPTCIGSEER